MGVHGLWELVAPVGRRVSVETLGNKKLAIDASIWIVQFLKAMRDDRGEVLRNAHLLGFFRRICKLLFLRVKPVFVFDGSTPFLKRRTVIARRRQRERAQAQIRKTAEKLLLNHLKTKKLEELVGEEEQTKQNTEHSKDVPMKVGAHEEKSQEDVDALLAASLAKEWEQDGPGSPIDCTGDSENDEQQILPVVQGKVDPAVLAALPPSMQLRLLDEMREQLVAENRQKFHKVAKAPSSFSQLQIEAYLKTVAFRREIVQVQKAAASKGIGGVPSTRIASEADREFIFSSFTHDDKTEVEVPKNRNVVEDGLTSSSSQHVPDTSAAPSHLLQAPSQQEKQNADDEALVQTYVDDNGKKRVSRIRGMGVRMTRDLQWNLYLMKDKEAKNLQVSFDENERFETDDDDYLFKNLVLGDYERNEVHSRSESFRDGEDTEIEWEDEPNEVHTISENNQDGEREDQGDNEILGKREDNKESSHVDTSADYLGGTNTMQITFEDDDSLHADDDMFKSLVSESQPPKDDYVEEIEWEEGDVEGSNSWQTVQADSLQQNGFSMDREGHKVLESEAGWEDRENGTSEKVAPDAMNCQEQAELEEAIRRSLVDHRPQSSKVFQSLKIQEPSSTVAKEDRPHQVLDEIEQERARKGKALLDDSTRNATRVDKNLYEASGSEYPSTVSTTTTEDITEQHEDVLNKSSTRDASINNLDEIRENRQSALLTEEDEAERNALSRAEIDEKKEQLLQEEEELRAEQKKNERNAESVSNEMFAECQELLQMFGLPYLIAPMEAEAQCAFMDAASLVDGVITDDSDVFLFGGRSVYKNIFDGHKYVETYYMKDVESDMGLNREKMIRMAMLLGSDYTEGISGIGIVNAIEVVNAFPEEDGLSKFKEWIHSPDLMLLEKLQPRSGKARKTGQAKTTKRSNESEEQVDETAADLDERKLMFMQKHRAVSKNWTVPHSFPSKAVVEAYASPQVDKSAETFTWGRPDLDCLRKFCYEKFGWTKDKVDELLLPVLKEYDRRETQLRLDAFYSFNERFAKIRSRRIQKAVTGITGRRIAEMMDSSAETAPPVRKPRRRKPSEDGAAVNPNKRKSRNSKNVNDVADANGQKQKNPRKGRAKNPPNASEAEEIGAPKDAGPPRKSTRARKQVNYAVDLPNERETACDVSLTVSSVPQEIAGASATKNVTSNTAEFDEGPRNEQVERSFPSEMHEGGEFISDHTSEMHLEGGFIPDDTTPEVHAGGGFVGDDTHVGGVFATYDNQAVHVGGGFISDDTHVGDDIQAVHVGGGFISDDTHVGDDIQAVHVGGGDNSEPPEQEKNSKNTEDGRAYVETEMVEAMESEPRLQAIPFFRRKRKSS